MGAKNKIIQGMLNHNGKEPDFIANEDWPIVKSCLTSENMLSGVASE